MIIRDWYNEWSKSTWWTSLKFENQLYADKLYNYDIIDGQRIKIQIAHNTQNPELYWVENIINTDAQLTSYGILNNQINGWIFTAKPIEYTNQLPWFITQGQEKTYTDVRPYIQKNPIIEKFKQIKQSQ